MVAVFESNVLPICRKCDRENEEPNWNHGWQAYGIMPNTVDLNG